MLTRQWPSMAGLTAALAILRHYLTPARYPGPRAFPCPGPLSRVRNDHMRIK